MDVAHFVDQRRAEIAAFAQSVFVGEGPRKKREKRTRSHLATTPTYRRPSSANTPLAYVVREAKDAARKKRRRSSGKEDGLGYNKGPSRIYTDYYVPRPFSPSALSSSSSGPQGTAGAKRGTGGEREAAAALRRRRRQLAVTTRHRRPLTPEAWRRFRKRRVQILARRRPTALRRRRLRLWQLRYGKALHPCSCTRAGRGSRKRCSVHRTRKNAILWLPSHRLISKGFQFRTRRLRLRGPTARAMHATPAGVSIPQDVSIAVPWSSNRKRHRCLQRWVSHLRYQNPWVFRNAPHKGKRGRRLLRPSSGKRHVKTSRRNTGAYALPPSLPAGGLTYHPPNGQLPPHALLADLTSHCVYEVRPRSLKGSISVNNTSLLSLSDWLFHCLGVKTDRCPNVREAVCHALSRHAKTRAARRQTSGTRKQEGMTPPASPPACGGGWRTFHGHAWCAEGREYDAKGNACVRTCSSASASAAGLPALVPVTIVVRCTKGQSRGPTAEGQWSHMWLLSEAPIHFPRHAFQHCFLRLRSLWSPCTSAKASRRLVSLFECWHVSGGGPRAVAERVARATRKALSALRRADVARRVTQQRKQQKQRSRGSLARRRRAKAPLPPDPHPRATAWEVLVFPSLPRNATAIAALHGQLSPADKCVWSILLVSHAVKHRTHTRAATRSSPLTAGASTTHKQTARRGVGSAVRLCPQKHRRSHFFVSRLAFNALFRDCGRGSEDRGATKAMGQRTERQPEKKRTPSASTPLGYRNGVKVIGGEDRHMLLRLLGRPVYPDDFTAPSGGESALSASSSQTDTYADYLVRWGSRDNAHQRVLVRAAGLGGRHCLPASHATVGSVLLRVCPPLTTGGRCVVSPLGLVSSPAFFSLAVGCHVAPVWLLLLPDAAESGNTRQGEGSDTTWLDSVFTRRTGTCAGTGHPAALHVLTSRTVAAKWCSLGARDSDGALAAAEAPRKRRRTDTDPRPQAGRRHRPRDLQEYMLRHPEVFTVVEVLQLFV